MKRTFLPKQRRYVESAKPEVIFSGAYGAGKTVALCSKVVFVSLKYPRNRGFLCRKTLQSLKSTTLKTLLDGDGDMPPILPKKYIRSHNKTDRVITLVNNSEILYGNMDIEFVKSLNLGWSAVDETSEIEEEEWNALIGRGRLASVPVRQVFGATNPSSPLHWIYLRHLNDKIGKMEFVQTSTVDNHYLPKDYISELERTLFGHYYQRFFLGQWVGSGKTVYDNFDPKVHLIDKFDVPKTWIRYRSIDFGFVSPFSCLWFAIAGDDAEKYGLLKGDIVLYRELYYTQRTTSINAERIIELSKYPDGEPEKFKATFADWDSGDRADLESKGIITIRADKDISSGIQRVREFLGNTDPSSGPLVRPVIYFQRNALAEHDPKIKFDFETGERTNHPTGVIEEIQSYSWKTIKGAGGSEEPEDRFNHAMDSLRYFAKGYSGSSQWKDIKFLKV